MKNCKIHIYYYALLLLLVFAGCAKIVIEPYEACRSKVIVPSTARRLPYFADDDYGSLNEALGKSIASLRSRPQDEKIHACGRQFTIAQQLETLIAFQNFLHSSGALNESIWDSFTICEVLNSNGAPDLLATGYYQPRFKGRRTYNPPFIYPLYKRPTDLVKYTKKNEGGSTNRVGRLSSGEHVPYWTRREIETQGLLNGQELLYLADPVDAFVLHVQGSAIVELEDGSVRQVLFDPEEENSGPCSHLLSAQLGQMS